MVASNQLGRHQGEQLSAVLHHGKNAAMTQELANNTQLNPPKRVSSGDHHVRA